MPASSGSQIAHFFSRIHFLYISSDCPASLTPQPDAAKLEIYYRGRAMAIPENSISSETRRPHLSRLNFPGSCYFDNGAATPMSAAAIESLTQACRQSWANPSSLHGTGREAREKVLEVEQLLREELGAQYSRIAFTGSGTEA